MKNVSKRKNMFSFALARLRFFLPCMLNDLSGLFARIIANFNENYHSFFLRSHSLNWVGYLGAKLDCRCYLRMCREFYTRITIRSRLAPHSTATDLAAWTSLFNIFSRLSFAACSTQVSSCRTCIAAQSTRRLCALDTIINFWIVCWNSVHQTDKSNFTERKYPQPNWISMLNSPHNITTGISSNPYNSADDDDDDDDVIYDFVLP